MHWTVLGSGSLGCLWAGYLSQAGFPVTLLYREGGSKPESLSLTRFQADQASAFEAELTTASACPKKSIHRLIVATKAQDALDALASIEHALTDDACIILLQNGMGSQQAIAAHYPDYAILAACITDGAYCTEPGHVVHAGQGVSRIGVLNHHSEKIAPQVIKELAHTELIIEASPQIDQVLWNKLAINIAINGLTALYQCLNGELLQPERYQRVRKLCAETETVMQALGLSLPNDGLLPLVTDVIHKTAENRSSMRQDTLRGKITEIDYINGYLIQQAKRLQIKIPENQSVYDEVVRRFSKDTTPGILPV